MPSILEPTVTLEAEEVEVRQLRQYLRDSRAALARPYGLHQIKLPDRLYKILLRIIDDLVGGKAVSLTLAAQELTTQEAAGFLGVSRQFLVRLFNEGKIPVHKVGTHRRVYLQDLMTFRKDRDGRRHDAIEEMARDAVKNGVYDDF